MNRQKKSIKYEAGNVRFAVTEVFKGLAIKGNEITLRVDSMRGTSCGDYGLKRGIAYIVYAYRDVNNGTRLYTGVCTRTREVSQPGTSNEDLDFLRSLPPVGTGGNLRGRVWVDVKKVRGGSAEPLDGINIVIRGPDETEKIATTDAEGKFSVTGLKAGRYRVELKLTDSYFAKDDVAEVDISDRGTADVGFEANFKGFVSGRLTDVNGTDYNEAFLHLRSATKGMDERRVYGHSDRKNGGFRFEGVPKGEYLLYLELQHQDFGKEKLYYYPGTFDRNQAAKIKVDLGKELTGLSFTLPKEYLIRTIEGQVVWKDGSPASGAEVLLLCPQSTNPNGFAIESMPPRETATKDGRFKIEAFAGETYWLQARGESSGSAFQSVPLKIAMQNDLESLKVVLNERGFSGSCGDERKSN